MNKIINDYGQEVPAVGAPGSKERLKVQYPKLIKFIGENLKTLQLGEIITIVIFSDIHSYIELVCLFEIIGEEYCSNTLLYSKPFNRAAIDTMKSLLSNFKYIPESK